MIIAIEGLPGTGKTTICQRLRDDMGYKYVPQRTASFFTAEKNKLTSVNKEELYFLNDETKSALAAKYSHKFPQTPIVIDRYYPSTLAYNYVTSKLSNDDSYTKALKWYSDSLNSRLIKADLYFYLNATPQESLKLKGRKVSNDFWSNPKTLLEVKKYYSWFFSKIEPGAAVVVIKVAKNREAVYRLILNEINKRV
ncbi:deoxynucleoside kinase [Candidatus Amesbacteria bacterium]|nr:deoxynucleoside kinase [Candidatus Amesbacteria bacterium]